MDYKKNNTDASLDTKKYIEELIKNPNYALNAIKMRNLKIGQLKAEIRHRIAAYNELQEKYNALYNTKQNISEEILDYTSTIEQLDIENNQLKKEKDNLKIQVSNFAIALNTIKDNILEEKKNSSWENKINKVAEALPLKVGNIFKFLLLPPINKFLLILCLIILFIASFIGWGGVAKNIKPVIDLFISSKSEGKK